ncbi:hypothetical protein SEUCBS139899_009757 [Sporothrix eucalyptigena]|uniref:Cystinosin n=1 Tax=Sporothrix eucalyptigena TaxID=1812306 RepID=A0ABP0CXS1_9PEZI
MDILAAISALCGWVYTICWSLSFYPQWMLNARRRSTAGTTVDFPFINCLGFISYLISTAALRYSSTVRAEYAARHHGLTPTVALNDVVFAAHALLLSFVCVSQYLVPQLWGWDKKDSREEAGAGLLAEEYGYDGRPQQRRTPRRTLRAGNSRPSRFILGVMTGCITGVAFIVLLVLRDNVAARSDVPYRGAQAMRAHMAAAAASANQFDAGTGSVTNSKSGLSATESAALLAAWMAGRWTWLDVVYALGYVKVIVTLVKYSPQVLANWRNRSTSGWSIMQIMMDFVGGVLSIAQLLLDSYRQQDWSGLTGNPVKLALGNVSMAYDLIFFTQHYVLYPHGDRGKEADEEGEGEGDEGEDNDDSAPNSSRIRASEREGLLSRE